MLLDLIVHILTGETFCMKLDILRDEHWRLLGVQVSLFPTSCYVRLERCVELRSAEQGESRPFPTAELNKKELYMASLLCFLLSNTQLLTFL